MVGGVELGEGVRGGGRREEEGSRALQSWQSRSSVTSIDARWPGQHRLNSLRSML